MCGIAGAYQQVDGEEATEIMGRCLEHRGPDQQGSFSYTDERVHVQFAHRRLSIIDLQHGQQPLVKRPFAFCYNGELYNYRESRSELIAGGSSFATTSDTEVVLEAWRRWGPGCLRRFRGMFAFACLTKRPARSSSPVTTLDSNPCTTSGARTGSCSCPS